MNPNLTYAQMVPGENDNKGHPYGVLDIYSIVEMLDGVALLGISKSWKSDDDKALKEWISKLLDWILYSEQGRAEAEMANNHSTAYDAEVMALAIYAGRDSVARKDTIF